MNIGKAKITQIGTVEGNHISGWSFDLLNAVPFIAIDNDGEMLVAGYSIEELGLIANLGFQPETPEA